MAGAGMGRGQLGGIMCSSISSKPIMVSSIIIIISSREGLEQRSVRAGRGRMAHVHSQALRRAEKSSLTMGSSEVKNASQ